MKFGRKGANCTKRYSLIRIAEVSVMLAFFVVICLLKLYYGLLLITERFRWPVLSILPTPKDKEKSRL